MKRLIFALVLIAMMSVYIPVYGQATDFRDNLQLIVKNMVDRLANPTARIPGLSRDVRMSGYLQEEYYEGWENGHALGLEYDNQGRISNITTKYWDWEFNFWSNDQRYTISYRADNLPQQVVIASWADTQWFNVGNMAYTYDDNRLITISVTYTFEEEPIEIMSYAFYYEADTNVIDYAVVAFSWWDFNDQRFSMHIDYNWDTQGRLQEVLTSYPDGMGEFGPSEKTLITYHPADTSTYMDFYTFLVYQTAMGEYDITPVGAHFMFDQEHSFYYDPDMMVWNPSEKYVYSYNPDLSLSMVQNYYMQERDWSMQSQDDFSYNADGTMYQWLYSNAWENELFPSERKTYSYTDVVDVEENISTPVMAGLKAWPNPFNPSTTISFELDKSSEISLDVYNLKGQKVRTLASGMHTKGTHEITWNGKNDRGLGLGSGMYILRLKTKNGSKTTKIMLLK